VTRQRRQSHDEALSQTAWLSRLADMRALFTPLLVTHVIVAMFGLGSAASVAVIAATARRTPRPASEAMVWLAPLLRTFAISLGVMLLTGILMDVAAGGIFSKWWWFRGSVLLLVAAGALHGQARRALRQAAVSEAAGDAALRRVQRLASIVCALIAAAAALMEAKPF
jgi:hypothetical protein